MLRTLGGLCLVLILLSVCAQKGIDRRFVAYLQHEKALRQKIHDENVLSDSLEALQKKFDIDRGQLLARVSNNPENWLFLLEALEATR